MVNKVILIGNIGKDPEIKTLDSGKVLCTFSLATNENYKDKAGEWQKETEWHNIVIWGNDAFRFDKLEKGKLIYVEGKVKTETYEDNEGVKRYSTKIQSRMFRMLTKVELEPFA